MVLTSGFDLYCGVSEFSKVRVILNLALEKNGSWQGLKDMGIASHAAKEAQRKKKL